MDANVTQDPEAGIFEDARRALMFALQHEMPPATSLARLMRGTPLGRTVGLAGFACAAQAGMIFAQLDRLPDAEILALVARSADHHRSCDCGSPCCSKYRPNEVWTKATGKLDRYLDEKLAGHVIHRRVRQHIIQRHFHYHTVTIEALAEACALSKRTVEEQAACIRRALRDIEGAGWHTFSEALTAAGYILISDYPIPKINKK